MITAATLANDSERIPTLQYVARKRLVTCEVTSLVRWNHSPTFAIEGWRSLAFAVTMLPVGLADFIQSRRMDLGLSVQAAAEKADLSDSKWRELESGSPRYRDNTLLKVARTHRGERRR